MKKKLISIFFIIIILILLFPKHINHAVIMNINKEDNYTEVYIDGVKRKINKVKPNFKKGTVINYYQSILMSFGFKEVPVIIDRVMIKSSNKYELESKDLMDLNDDVFFYKIDSNNNIKPASRNDLIVGMKDIKFYKDEKNKIRTIIIPPIDYSSMRVGISTNNFMSTDHEFIEIKCLSPSKLYSVKDKVSIDIPEHSYISIKKNEDTLKVKINDLVKTFKSRVYLSGPSLIITNIQRGAPPYNPSYSGVLEFNCTDNGMSIINEVNIEDYLCKVVPSEIPASSNLEALKCQAIAARTYAISDMLNNRFQSKGYYVDDSTNSQVYNNVLPQKSTNEAINATKGIIMTFNNKAIDAKYYSTSCGTGVRYQDIWFKSNGDSEYRPYFKTTNYLNSETQLPKTENEWLKFYKDTNKKAIDSNSQYFRWSMEISNTELTKTLNKSLRIIYDKRKDFIDIKKDNKTINTFPELGKLTDIKILKRSKGGNVIKICFVFDDIKVYVKGDLNVRSALRCTTSVISYKGNVLSNINLLPSSFFSIEKKDDKYIIYGGGYGHGVGMSQYGAMELAKQGMKYNDILNIYYKDISLKNILYTKDF